MIGGGGYSSLQYLTFSPEGERNLSLRWPWGWRSQGSSIEYRGQFAGLSLCGRDLVAKLGIVS